MPRMLVAMSGGVDSSVAAFLLNRNPNNEVIGVTLKLWDPGDGPKRKRSCCAPEEIADAASVAKYLGIEHHTLDYQDLFRKEVVDPFVIDYLSGKTPNPCTSCNAKVKFGDYLGLLKKFGADILATGHYAGVNDGMLWRNLSKKDQTYFLYGIPKEALARLKFPLWHYDKDLTRETARQAGIPTSEKPDSQEICFLATSHGEFIEKEYPESKEVGPIKNNVGSTIGYHYGVHNFTIGQRRQLGIALHEPMYVTGLDATTNTVIVGSKDHLDSCKKKFVKIYEFNNLVSNTIMSKQKKVMIKLRSAQPLAPATIVEFTDSTCTVELDTGLLLTPGQAAVVYSNELVLGGGLLK